MPPRRSARTSTNNDDIAGMVAQQLAGMIPNIVAQVTAAIQQQQPPHHPPPPPDNGGAHPLGGAQYHIVQGCTYKEFLACKPKEFDGKGGALALNRWFEKTEAVIDISKSSDLNKVRFASNSLIGKALTTYITFTYTHGAWNPIYNNNFEKTHCYEMSFPNHVHLPDSEDERHNLSTFVLPEPVDETNTH